MKRIDNEATIRIVQVNQTRWQIETRQGYVLTGDIHLSGKIEAETYVKNYLSSFLCWNYEVVPLNKEKK